LTGFLLFGLCVTAAWLAAYRVAGAWAGGGWGRAATAFVLLGVVAVTVPVASGLLGLKASQAAMAAITLALAAGALAVRPAAPAVEARPDPWPVLPAAAMAAVMLGLELGRPSVATDGFHLADVAIWVHDRAPGSSVYTAYEWPAGAYPLVNELILTWGNGIARAFSPTSFWTVALTAALALATMAGLAQRGVRRAVAALAALTVVLVTFALAGSEGAGTDLPALAWLALAAAFMSHPDPARRLPGPALLAAGLSVGTKTNMAFALLPLLLVTMRGTRWRGGEWAALVAGLALAGAWPLRNLIEHGSPLWPFSDLLGGDPLPPILAAFDSSFLSSPSATLRADFDHYPRDTLLVGCVLVAYALIASRSRRTDVRAASAITVAGFLLWAASPLSGVVQFAGDRPGAVLWYILPVLVTALAAVALASRDHEREAVAALAACAAASLFAFTWPERAGVFVVLLAGAAALLVRRPPPLPGPALAAAAAAVVLAAGAAAGADRYLRDTIPAVRWLHRPSGASGDGRRIVSNWSLEGRMSGPRLEHPIELLRQDGSCAYARARARGAWALIRREAGVRPPFDAGRRRAVLPRPAPRVLGRRVPRVRALASPRAVRVGDGADGPSGARPDRLLGGVVVPVGLLAAALGLLRRGGDQPGGDARGRQQEVQDVVGAVDRDDPEDLVALDEADQRHQRVDEAEAERDRLGRRPRVRRAQQQQARREVHEVVPAVDLEAEQRSALELVAGLEAALGEEAEDARDEQRDAGEQAVPLRQGLRQPVIGGVLRHRDPPQRVVVHLVPARDGFLCATWRRPNLATTVSRLR
jgi:hypothetical protein